MRVLQYVYLLLSAMTPSLVQAQEIVNVGFIYPQSPRNAPTVAYDNGLAGELAYRGAAMAAEELGWRAQAAGQDFRVLMAVAPDATSAERTARRLVLLNDVEVIVGGFGGPQADAISSVAEELGVPFINIGSTSRQHLATEATVNIMPSAEVFLAAMASSELMTEHEHWLVIVQDTDESHEWLEVARDSFLPADPARTTVIEVDSHFPVYSEVLDCIAASPETAVLGLIDWRLQLELSNQMEASGALPGSFWLLPDIVTGTREFLGALRQSAPRTAPPILTMWDPTLALPGAAELNARFEAHYGVVMDPPAWAAYQAIQLAFAIVNSELIQTPDAIADLFATLDMSKGEPLRYDSSTGELFQSLYLVRLEPRLEEGSLLERERSRARVIEVIW